MDHTWFRLFFWIVLCCPVAVAAEDGNSTQGGQRENAAFKDFRDCVLKTEEWKTKCSEMPPFSSKNPYSPKSPYSGSSSQERVFSDNLVPERGGVWGPTPAEVYREYYLPDKKG